MKKEKISVIVPVYNVEQYLTKCVKSICNQTYLNLEIILVDDGSTDNSGKICDQLASVDTRIIVVHKKNGGLSDARNAGLKIATGHYIGFVDSDDWVDSHMYEALESGMTTDCMITCCRSMKHEEHNTYLTKEEISQRPYLCSNEEAIRLLLQDKVGKSVCSKLFLHRLFDGIIFPVGVINEDFAVVYKLFAKSPKITFCNDGFYHYIKRNDSITNSMFNIKQFDRFENSLKMVDYIQCNWPSLKSDAYDFVFHTISYLCLDMVRAQKLIEFSNQYKIMRNYVLHNLPKLLLTKMTFKEKISILYIILFPQKYLECHNV